MRCTVIGATMVTARDILSIDCGLNSEAKTRARWLIEAGISPRSSGGRGKSGGAALTHKQAAFVLLSLGEPEAKHAPDYARRIGAARVIGGQLAAEWDPSGIDLPLVDCIVLSLETAASRNRKELISSVRLYDVTAVVEWVSIDPARPRIQTYFSTQHLGSFPDRALPAALPLSRPLYRRPTEIGGRIFLEVSKMFVAEGAAS